MAMRTEFPNRALTHPAFPFQINNQNDTFTSLCNNGIQVKANILTSKFSSLAVKYPAIATTYNPTCPPQEAVTSTYLQHVLVPCLKSWLFYVKTTYEVIASMRSLVSLRPTLRSSAATSRFFSSISLYFWRVRSHATESFSAATVWFG
jgi:hypothetical protein